MIQSLLPEKPFGTIMITDKLEGKQEEIYQEGESELNSLQFSPQEAIPLSPGERNRVLQGKTFREVATGLTRPNRYFLHRKFLPLNTLKIEEAVLLLQIPYIEKTLITDL